jgi:hypothetical protein
MENVNEHDLITKMTLKRGEIRRKKPDKRARELT